MEVTLITAGLVLALVQVVVKPFVSDGRFYPIASILFGLAFVIARVLVTTEYTPFLIYQAVLEGLVVGLTASGAYSGQAAIRGQ